MPGHKNKTFSGLVYSSIFNFLSSQNSDLTAAKKDLGALNTTITAKVNKADLEIGAITATMVSGVTAKSGYAAAYGRLCVINLVVTAIALQTGTYNLFQIESKKPLSNIPVYIYDDVRQVACPGEITSAGYVKIATAGRAAGDIRVMGVFYAAE